MGMTITEKIIAAHAGVGAVRPGEFVYADVDIALGNDITAPLAIEELQKAGIDKVFDPDKIALVPDHSTPNKDMLYCPPRPRAFTLIELLVRPLRQPRHNPHHPWIITAQDPVEGDIRSPPKRVHAD